MRSLGLSNYWARYYDPDIGRFLSEDPITFLGGANFYRYVNNSPIGLVDPEGLESADSTEKWNDIVGVGYWNSYKAWLFSREALAAAMEWAKEHNFDHSSVHNGAPDAFRHCFWSCTMAKYLGQDVAETIGDQHEMGGRRGHQPANEEQMDRANNLIGRTCANRKDKNCWDACTDSYNQGKLFGLGAHPLSPL